LLACSSVNSCTLSSQAGLAGLQGFKQVAAMEVVVGGLQRQRFVPHGGLDAQFGSPVELDKVLSPWALISRKLCTPNPSMVRRLRGMVRSLMIHITMCMDSGISEMKSQNVSWAEAACGKPRSGSIFTAYKVGKLHRVLDEEHRHVVADQIPVAFVGIELDGETTHVARSVHRASTAGHGGKAHEDGYLLPVSVST
jgi:hypothetical protein